MQYPKHQQKWRALILVLLVITTIYALLTGPVNARQPTARSADKEYLAGQVIVKLKQANARAIRDRWPFLFAHAGGGRVQVLRQIPQLNVMLLQVSPGSETLVIAQLQHDPLVQYAELDYKTHALEVPNDPSWSQQWALPKIGAPQAWDITHCQGIIVAVLDTGVDLEHPDLQPVLWTNSDEIPDNGIDDDANGKVDDIHGWHFFHQNVGGTYEPYENPFIQDDNGHGTHVTGIIAAETNNALGISGISWGARVMTIKVLDEQGEGWYSDIAAAITYATDNGAKVINLSLGGEEPSYLLQEAINYAHQRDVLLVAASGNDGGSVLYPAACDNVLAVAATDSQDKWQEWSNHGPEVDLAAPGVGIISTWPWQNGYLYKSGTSMAAPHVAGAAALLWSWRPDFSNIQIEQRLENQADDVNAQSNPGHDPYIGWGRLNIYRALSGLAPSPTQTPPTTYIYRLLPIHKNYTP